MVTTPVTSITFEEYLTYDDGNNFHYELVDGKLELMNPPTIEHFLIAKFLEQGLDAEIKRFDILPPLIRSTECSGGFQRSLFGFPLSTTRLTWRGFPTQAEVDVSRGVSSDVTRRT